MDTGIYRQIDAWVGTSPADNTESADSNVIDTGIDRQMPGLELVLLILNQLIIQTYIPQFITTKNYSILGADAKLKKKYHIDTVSLNFPKKDMEVETYMKDGMIDNWDVFEKVTIKELP